MKLEKIGSIHTPYEKVEDCPYFASVSQDNCTLEINDEFKEGLKGLDEVTHIIVVYWLDQANRDELHILNPHDDVIRGVFAMRGQHRPNSLGISIVKILDIKDNLIIIDGIDCLNGTILLDIKPYDSTAESIPEARIKWYGNLPDIVATVEASSPEVKKEWYGNQDENK